MRTEKSEDTLSLPQPIPHLVSSSGERPSPIATMPLKLLECLSCPSTLMLEGASTVANLDALVTVSGQSRCI